MNGSIARGPARNGARWPERAYALARALALAAGCLGCDGSGPARPADRATPVGTLRVAVSTTGSDLDDDGYLLTVYGGRFHAAVAANGTVTIPGLPLGVHRVVLTGVASNCRLADGPALIVTVAAGGEIVDAAFTASCAPLGRLRVTAATTGVDLDLDGYRVTVDPPLDPWDYGGGPTRDVASNGTVTLVVTDDGDHRAVLNGIAPNCRAADSTARRVRTRGGDTAAITFDVVCASAAPPRAAPPAYGAPARGARDVGAPHSPPPPRPARRDVVFRRDSS